LYLKRLEMQGFKSFAKKADLSFNNSITIVVGPNGSGKSNIVDAIRWVLGEGSAKSLRGSKMEDVIFSGSTDKKPLGMAQVSLTLDNSTGIFPVDYNEIKITRKLFRSGESEYLINNVRCRQKDIHELIMDTGIGKDGFSIIGQGKVDQILLSQADEKRALIEEVAGISKYRYRKNEAKRKLADTENSLLRVKDIVAELESQKEPLREQAEKARIYKEYKGQLDDLEINLAKFTISNLEEKSEKIKSEKEITIKDNILRETSIIKDESKIEEMSLNLENLIRESAEIQNKIYQISNEINDYENKKDFSGKMMENLKENHIKLQTEKSKVFEELSELSLRKKEEENKHKEILENFEKIAGEFKKEENKINNIKNSESGVNQKIQDIKAELFEYAQNLSEIRNKIIDLEKREAVIGSGEEGIKNKLSRGLEFKNVKVYESEEIKKELLLLDKEKQDLLTKILEIAKNKKIIAEKIINIEESLNKKNKEKERKQVNVQALEALENNKEGYSAGVKSVFANKNLRGVIGTVADLADTPSEYRLAVETALGGAIQNIVTENEVYAKNAIDYLRENKAGRATFLPLSLINERVKNKKIDTKRTGLVSAIDVITFQERFSGIFMHLLGGIYFAPNMEEALKYNKNQDRPVKIVTLKGEVIDPRGAMTGGQYRNNQEGFLLRKEKIKELNLDISELIKEVNLEEKELSNLQKQVGKVNEELADIEKNNLEKDKKKQELENVISQIDFQIKETEKDILLLQEENKDLREEKERIAKEKEENKTALLLQEKEKNDRENLLQKLQDEAEKEKSTLIDLERSLSKIEISYVDLKNKKENKESQLNDLNFRIINLEEKGREQEREEKEINLKISDLQKNEYSFKEDIKNSEIILSDLEKKSESLRELKEEKEKSKKSLEEEVKKNRRIYEEIKDSVHSKEIILEKYLTEINSLKENLQERFNIIYHRSIQKFDEDFSERSSKQKVRELRKNIDELGEVNLIAISEYDKLLERYTFLNTQCIDLDEAKDSLVKIIDEMDHIIVKKFKDTYLKLNEAFKETFSDMFNGGSAEIVMTDKENVLETGIEIIAQPPGKTPKHLSLLSGGEKAMTAICLLFAILKIKPGPFCILDEIEASLDESNVARFAGFLKKFAQLTQFVVISHRKGTMEAGDVLYGVTMEEKGISSLISVRISETIKLTS